MELLWSNYTGHRINHLDSNFTNIQTWDYLDDVDPGDIEENFKRRASLSTGNGNLHLLLLDAHNINFGNFSLSGKWMITFAPNGTILHTQTPTEISSSGNDGLYSEFPYFDFQNRALLVSNDYAYMLYLLDYDGDTFPDILDSFASSTQWSDVDDDGYGDNAGGNFPDECITHLVIQLRMRLMS